MPIAGITIHLICPMCGVAIDAGQEDSDVPRETPNPLLKKTVAYRCPACDHLGQVHIEARAE